MKNILVINIKAILFASMLIKAFSKCYKRVNNDKEKEPNISVCKNVPIIFFNHNPVKNIMRMKKHFNK